MDWFANAKGMFAAGVSLADTRTFGEVFIDDTKDLVETGVGGLWVLANVSYAGMRAQGSPSWGWRALAFFFGLPGTVLSFIVIREGSNRAYGVFLPPRPPDA